MDEGDCSNTQLTFVHFAYREQRYQHMSFK